MRGVVKIAGCENKCTPQESLQGAFITTGCIIFYGVQEEKREGKYLKYLGLELIKVEAVLGPKTIHIRIFSNLFDQP